MRKVQEQFFAPLPPEVRKLANKHEGSSRTLAKIDDVLTGSRFNRRVLRHFDRDPFLEAERRPEVLTRQHRDDEKQRRLVARLRRSSIDG